MLTSLKRSVESTVKDFKYVMDVLISKYATRLLKLRVDEIEVKLRILDEEQGIYYFILLRLRFSEFCENLSSSAPSDSSFYLFRSNSCSPDCLIEFWRVVDS